jgi:hypothetical protein
MHRRRATGKPAWPGKLPQAGGAGIKDRRKIDGLHGNQV